MGFAGFISGGLTALIEEFGARYSVTFKEAA